MYKDRELADPRLVIEVANTEIKRLTKEHTKKEVPMSKFMEIILWESKELRKIYSLEMQRELAANKRDGWKVESHTWCGIPINEFKIPSLGIF